MKKVLFIDRDGVLINEPPETCQVDTLEQLVLKPGLIRNLYRIITELDFELVMVTNQDGLGTQAYPEENFNRVQGKLLQLLENEGIRFDAIFVDRSYEYQGLSTRKPGTGMLTEYMDGSYDLSGSYVIGDRPSDVELARNLGARAIGMKGLFPLGDLESAVELYAGNWDEIYAFLKPRRVGQVQRKTRETDIRVRIDLDGGGQASIQTGLGFFDHMLDQIARHAEVDLEIKVIGDLHVDEHHTIEDTAIALGEAIALALADKRGIQRYGFCLPMDDCLAQVALDFGGRPWLEWEAPFNREKIGDMPTEMFLHFFKSLSDAARCNLHVKATGSNEHHKIEAIFKAFARALKMAKRKEGDHLPSTKGLL